MSAISSSLMFCSLIFLLMMNNLTKSFFFIIIFIWYIINSSFSLLFIEPYVSTCTSWRILAASKISLSFYFPFTIINTHLAYSTSRKIFLAVTSRMVSINFVRWGSWISGIQVIASWIISIWAFLLWPLLFIMKVIC